MCGITGWVSYERDLTHQTSIIDRMTTTMAYRGPDASGTWIRRHVALGHRRLAIIDLPGGAQPMSVHTPMGEVVVVYSGEVYNFVELRADLATRGHRFTTSSDTEVVLRGYMEWGQAVAEHLNGMFALAIWDERRDMLAMIRDRLGVKPLYYYPTSDGVLFGSEPKAIFANPLADRLVAPDGLRELFTHTQSADRSLWKGMHEVPPGAIVTVNESGIQSQTYWTLPSRAHRDDPDVTIETIREIMTDTVRRQLVADVPQCVLLSGGLDSSTITGLAAAHLAEKNRRLHTYSVDFVGHAETFKPNDLHVTLDAPYVRDVTELVGSAHRNTILDVNEIADPSIRRAVINARDMPGLGELDASLYLLFKAIRSESTVALSGESADELFGGYQWFHHKTIQAANTFPWHARQSMSSSSANPALPMLRQEVATSLDLSEYIDDQYASAVARIEHIDGATEKERRMRTICNLVLTRFLRTWLDRKDRVSMAVGLEVRVPFCDHRLVEYVYNVPWSLKTFDHREKSLLRHAAKHLLPRSVTYRAKSGFPMTQNSRYFAALQRQAADILTDRDHDVFSLVNREWLTKATQADLSELSNLDLSSISKALDLYHWINICKPNIMLG